MKTARILIDIETGFDDDSAHTERIVLKACTDAVVTKTHFLLPTLNTINLQLQHFSTCHYVIVVNRESAATVDVSVNSSTSPNATTTQTLSAGQIGIFGDVECENDSAALIASAAADVDVYIIGSY